MKERNKVGLDDENCKLAHDALKELLVHAIKCTIQHLEAPENDGGPYPNPTICPK